MKYYGIILFIIVNSFMAECLHASQADLNGDCKIDFQDLCFFLNEWLSFENEQRADLNDDKNVNFVDFVVFSKNWNQKETRIYNSGSFWYMENIYLKITLSESGYISIYDKETDSNWNQPGAIMHMAFTNFVPSSEQLKCRTQLAKKEGGYVDCDLRFELSSDTKEFRMYTTTIDPTVTFTGLVFLEPFAAPNTNGSSLAVADWTCGHLYPTNISSWPVYNLDDYDVGLLLLPWIGVVDVDSGLGYSVTIDTPYDAKLKCLKLNGRRAPLIEWQSESGKIGYERGIIYNFTASGSYVSLAKDLRIYLKNKGCVKTFADKAATRPRITNLFGAPLLWDYFHFMSTNELYNIGVSKAIHFVHHWDSTLNNLPSNAAEINAEKSKNWLVQEYLCFADGYPCNAEHILPEPFYDYYPNNFMKNENGNVLLGWLDSNGQQYKRCSEFFVERALGYIPTRLINYPLNSLYLDVHPQRELNECWDIAHPKAKRNFQNDSLALLKYLADQPLVMSGETGKWWSVPYLDIPMGPMSVLSRPWGGKWVDYYHQLDFNNDGNNDTTISAWDKYETWGSVGHEYRIPLWQLVFHDCTSTVWYCTDSVDYTSRAERDSIFPFSYHLKKEVISILYGSVPTFTVISPNGGQAGAWTYNKLAFMRTYRNTCKLHEIIGDKEMVSHEFVTTDRHIQKTLWSDGTEVIVNFGSNDYILDIGDNNHIILKQFGWYVNGPSYNASCAYDTGIKKVVTNICQPNKYYFTDFSGVSTSMKVIDHGSLRINADDPGKPYNVKFYPKKLKPDWNFNNMSVFYCNKTTGARVGTLPFSVIDDHIETVTISGWAILDVVCE